MRKQYGAKCAKGLEQMTDNVLKGLLIDPETQTITEVEVYPDDNGETHLRSMYELLQCRCVDVGRNCLNFLPSSPADDIWFDDEGNFSDNPFRFQIPGLVPLVGRALILSYDGMGGSTSHTLTAEDIEELKFRIAWGRRYYI